MTTRLALSLTAFLLASSCSHVLKDMKSRAAFDFPCPEDQISVSALGGYAYGAKGCGKVLKCNDVPYAGLLCSAVEADPQSGAPAAAATR